MTLREIYRAGITFWFGNHYKLDAYVLRDGKKHPFALICPGGAYMLVSEENEGHTFAVELNRRGISAFVLHYRCRRKGRYPAPQQDVARALHEILVQADALHLDAENYSLWGSSAGGHLAASFATHEMGCSHYGLPQPAVLVLCYPVITMGAYGHKQSRQNLLGPHPSADLVQLTSVENHITPDFPPTYVWSGDADHEVDVQNSRLLVQALRRCSVDYMFRLFPGVGHGVGLGKGLSCAGWLDEAVAFWSAHNRGEQQKS